MELDLDGAQKKQFREALLSAFPNYGALAMMVSDGLNENLAVIAGGDGNPLNAVVFDLIGWAETQGRTDELLVAARLQNPRNPPLRMFAGQFNNLASPTPPQTELERMVLKSVKFENVESWRTQMSQCELAVCRIEILGGEAKGTGFLLGPNIAMTNYHVMENVIVHPDQSDTVVLRFDYKMGVDGETLRSGQTFHLDADWLMDSSPEAALDYALLRVAGNPGQQSVGGQAGAPTRGWLKPEAREFVTGEPVFILQHPLAEPLQLAFGSITEIEAGSNRIHYSANTEHGSSGSPCFDYQWDLVALHRAGRVKDNEGVPFSAILDQPKVKAALPD